MTKNQKLQLMALRCGYISFNGAKMTFKASLFLPPWVWRLIFRIRCLFKPSLKMDMFELLNMYYEQQTN
jgi:hypothetical protein